uniref:(northern house mosquito) hypothetical protein n=1 Tax=Culex pipiens TaxID=7175 RepID=A0A8D8CFG5_CULPI
MLLHPASVAPEVEPVATFALGTEFNHNVTCCQGGADGATLQVISADYVTSLCRVGTNRLISARARHTATKSLSRPADPAVSAIEPRKSHWDPEGRPHATRGSRESHPSRQPFLSSRWSRFAAGVHQTVDVGPRGHAPSRFPKEATRPPGRPAGQA